MYELLADDADALAFDRTLDEYRCAPLVELRLLDWAHTIARRWLYEVADEIRIAALMEDDDARVAGLAAKINREEAYHRMHAEMWRERLADDAAVPRGGRRAVAVRPRRAPGRAARGARGARRPRPAVAVDADRARDAHGRARGAAGTR